jgi:hypothetical protein
MFYDDDDDDDDGNSVTKTKYYGFHSILVFAFPNKLREKPDTSTSADDDGDTHQKKQGEKLNIGIKTLQRFFLV